MNNPLIYTWGADALQAVENRLNEKSNLAVLDTVARANQTLTPEGYYQQVSIRTGRAKVKDRYPTVCLELVDEADPFEALAFTREITVSLNILTLVKTPGAETSDQKLTEQLEYYIAKLAGSVKSILNAPANLAYRNINSNGDHIFDSGCGKIDYGFLYGGAVRADNITAKIRG